MNAFPFLDLALNQAGGEGMLKDRGNDKHPRRNNYREGCSSVEAALLLYIDIILNYLRMQVSQG